MKTFRQISKRLGALKATEHPSKGYVPSYLKLSGQLLDCMAVDTFRPGDKFYSIREVAEVSDVSRITVHGAFRELAKKGFLSIEPRKVAIVKRIPGPEDVTDRVTQILDRDLGEAAHDMSALNGKHAEAVASEGGLKQLRLGVVLSQWDKGDTLSWNNQKILPAMLEEASDLGISIQVISCALAVNDPAALDAQVMGNGLNGLIWLSMRERAIVSASRWAGRSFVQLTVSGRPDNLDIPMVCEDNFKAGEQTARLVAEGGYESVLVLCGSTSVNTYPQRLSGYREGMKTYGLEGVAHHFIELPEGNPKSWFVPVIAGALAECKPTLIVSLLDVMATLHSVFDSAGIRVGKDLDVIGFSPPESLGWDARIPFRFWRPRLQEIGRKAINAWLECWTDAKERPSNSDWRKVSRHIPMDLDEYVPPLK